MKTSLSQQRLLSYCLATALLCLAPFVGRGQFTYTTNDGALTITRYNGRGGNVTIPSEANGLPVTAIGQYAFSVRTSVGSVIIPQSITNIGIAAFNWCTLTNINLPTSIRSIPADAFGGCTNLATVNIPFPVTSIGENAFFGCLSLSTVSLPDSLTDIAGGAFVGCKALSAITIPSSVTTIGYLAFANCTSLTAVTIPKSVTNLADRVFYSCLGLTGITVEALNPSYSSLDGVLFDKNQTTLIRYPAAKPGAYAIPYGVTNIAVSALSKSAFLTNVTIPPTVTAIPNSAFSGCSNLTSVTMAPGVLTIADTAFSACGSLSTITIPDTVTTIGNQAFGLCIRLTEVTVGSRVTSIGQRALNDCHQLRAVRFRGDAPTAPSDAIDTGATVYYLPGTTGWGSLFANCRTVAWYLPNPTILDLSPYFGLQTNRFAFRISWATNATVTIEASTTLGASGWLPLATNALVDGWSYFSDPEWTNDPARFYRARSP